MKTEKIHNHFAMTFIIFVLCYSIINFLFLPHNQLISYPVQLDDYAALSAKFSAVSWIDVRPVSYFLAACFAQLGRMGYYLLVPGLVILCATLVFRFARNVCSVSPPIGWLILYAILLFSSSVIIDVSKFLGITINLCSASLGVISMLALLKGYRENKSPFFILAAFFFTLTIFTKEDFILPNFLLIFYLFLFEKKEGAMPVQDHRKIKLLIYLVYSIIAIVALILFDKYLVYGGNGFVGLGQSQSTAYDVNMTVPSIFHMLIHYLTINTYATMLTITALLIFILCLFFAETKIKIKILFLAGVMVSLVLPYSTLPNHIFAYYSYNWLPWEAAVTVFGLFLLAPSVFQKSKKISFLLLCIIAIAAMKISYSPRHGMALWYNHAAEINKNILVTLLDKKQELNQEQYVGVVNAAGLMPWSNTTGNYLFYNLGIKPKWIVFVDKSTIFLTINANDQLDSNKLINVLSTTKICDFPHMKYLYLAPDGKGRLTDNCKNIG